MNASIPTGQRITVEEFKRVLDGVNWRRDAYYNGEIYFERDTGIEVGFCAIDRSYAILSTDFIDRRCVREARELLSNISFV